MNFLKRFIAAAVALVMVLALVPAGALVANAADVTYVLESSALETFAAGAKADGETETAGTDNFFTLHWGSKTKLDTSSKTFTDGYKSGQRINWQGKTTVGTTPMYCASFTTGGSAAVKVWWVSGGDGREVAILNADGTVAANTDATESVKNSLYVSELTLSEAGTYYLGSTAGSNYLFKVEVTVSEGHTHEYSSVVTAPTCDEKGYTTYTCTVDDCGYSYVGDYVDPTGHSFGEDGYCVCGRCEHAVDTTYTFVSTELTASADKEAVEDGTKLGTNGFFTANVEAAAEGEDPNMPKRYSSSKGVYAVELGKGGSGTISFTLTGTADVTVLAASTGGENVSDLTLVDEYGSTVAEDNGAATVTGTGNVAFTYSDLSAGTYYVTNPGTARNTRVASIEVVETANAGCEHNPITLFIEEQTETVTVPAGKTLYFQGYINGMNLTINGEDKGLQTSANPRMPVIFTITNDGAEAAEYVLSVSYPAGTMSNPEAIEAGSYTAELAENNQGYYYNFTAPADGTVTVTMDSESGWQYVVNSSAGIYGDNHWYDDDPVVASESVEVAEGDVVTVMVITYDAANMWSTPAGTIEWTLEFEEAPGTEQNPIGVFYMGQTETVTVPAGKTLYFQGYINGMNLSINGEDKGLQTSANPRMPVIFSITNDGAEAAEYVLAVSYPVGTMSNPEAIETGSYTAELAENNQGYYYNFTAPADGVVTVTMDSESGWQYVVNSSAGIYGDNHWYDDDPVVASEFVEVAEGDVVTVMVITYDAANMWATPAGSVEWTLDFVSAEALAQQEIVDAAYELGNNEWLDGIQTLTGKIVAITEPYSSYKNVTVTIAVEGREDKPIVCYRIVAGEGITEDDMAGLLIGDTITVTGYITNYNGNTVEFSTKDGVKGTLDAIEKTEEIPFTLNFVVPEGVAPVASVSGNQNGVTMPSAGAPEGYSFVGWVTGSVSETTDMPENVILGGTAYVSDEDQTLYALYTYGDVSYSLYTGELVEGDYVIAYNDGTDDGALKAAMGTSNRLAYSTITVVNGVVTDATTDLVWHIAPNGDYWTIYNSAAGKYAAATSTNNKGALLDSVTNYAKWTVTGTDTYEFENLGNGRYLRRNGTYGFAAYSSSTGGALSLYKLSGTYYYSTLDAEAEVEKFNLAGANLELANDITMYFYVYAKDVADGYYMEIVKTNADGSKVTKQVAMADWNTLGDMYYVGFNGMAAKEMADEISVTVYNAEGVQVSNSTVTSISAYALRALDNAAYASMHTMMADLLNYGAAAQTFFKYNTSNLANANMTETHQSYATKGFDMSKYTNDVVVGTGVVGANLSLETNILQNFYFDPAVVDNTMTAKVTYTNYKGVEKTVQISGDKFGTMPGYGYVIVEVAVLVPADVMSLVSVEIVNADGDVVASVSDSISSYAVRANTSSPDPLYVELMEYCLSCEAYFG